MNLKMMSALASMLALASASAQVLPTEDKTVNRTFPPEPGFQNDTQYKKAFEDIKSQVDVLRRQAEGAQRTLMATGVDVSVPLKTGSTPKGRIGGGGRLCKTGADTKPISPAGAGSNAADLHGFSAHDTAGICSTNVCSEF